MTPHLRMALPSVVFSSAERGGFQRLGRACFDTLRADICSLSEKLASLRSEVFRPVIPRLTCAALVLWAATAASYSTARCLSLDACRRAGFLFGILAVLCALAFFLFRHGEESEQGARRLALAQALLVACAGGAALGFATGASMHASLASPPAGGAGIRCALREDASLQGDTWRVCAVLPDVDGSENLVQLSFDEDPGLLLYGDELLVSAYFKSCEASDYVWGRGISAQADVKAFELLEDTGALSFLRDLRKQAICAFSEFGGRQAGVLQALVCGWRGGVDATGEYEDYKITGLAHVIAVSGSHLAVVAMFVNVAAVRLGLPARLRVAGVLLLVGSYLVFSGCSVSAARSVVMVVVGLSSLFAARRSSSLNALGICVFAFLLLDPKVCVSVSFLLSAGSTLGIILFASLLISWFSCGKTVRTLLVEPLALTFASSMTTQLYSAALFSQLSLISPLANIVVAPLFALGCVVGLVAAVVVCACPAVGQFVMSAAAVSVVPMQLSVEALASRPLASVPFAASELAMLLASVVLCALVYRAWPSARCAWRCLAGLSLLLAVPGVAVSVERFSADELIMLDVGQGDSLVIRSGGASLMVDTGNRTALLKEALGRNGVWGLDGVLITHADDDHCASLGDLAYALDVDSVLLSEGAASCSCGNCRDLVETAEGLRGKPELSYLSQGDVLHVGDFTLEVLWPDGFQDEGGNADSICLLLRHRESGASALLTGDAESEVIERIVAERKLGRIDVLKVGHHGSKDAVTPEQLEDLDPSVALVSVGEGNRYGHPHADTVADLEESGASVLRTDECGDVSIRFKADGTLRVSTQH